MKVVQTQIIRQQDRHIEIRADRKTDRHEHIQTETRTSINLERLTNRKYKEKNITQ